MPAEIAIPLKLDDAAAEAAWEAFRQRATAGAKEVEEVVDQTATQAVRELAAEAERAGIAIEDFTEGVVQGMREEAAAAGLAADAMRGLGRETTRTEAPVKASTKNMFAWKEQMGRSREAAMYLTSAVSSIAPATGVAGAGLRSLSTIALAGTGPMLKFIVLLEAVRFASELVAGRIAEKKRREEEARKAAEDHAKALREVDRDLEEYLLTLSGASPILIELNRQMKELDERAAPLNEKMAKLGAILAEMPVGALGSGKVLEEVAKLQEKLDRIEAERQKKRDAAVKKNAEKAAQDAETERLEVEAALVLAMARADQWDADQRAKKQEKAKADQKAYDSWREQTLIASLEVEARILAEFDREWAKLRSGDLDTAYALIERRDKALLDLEVKGATERADVLASAARAEAERAASEVERALAGFMARADRFDMAQMLGLSGGDLGKAKRLQELEAEQRETLDLLDQMAQEQPQFAREIELARTQILREGSAERRRILGDEVQLAKDAFTGMKDSIVDGFAEATARGIAFSEDVGEALMALVRGALAEVNAEILKLFLRTGIRALAGSLGGGGFSTPLDVTGGGAGSWGVSLPQKVASISQGMTAAPQLSVYVENTVSDRVQVETSVDAAGELRLRVLAREAAALETVRQLSDYNSPASKVLQSRYSVRPAR